jgi:hypothetical protein
MSLEDLSGSPVCLVLTCQKTYYQERLRKNADTWAGLVDAGFHIIFLYGDASRRAWSLERRGEHTWNLFVPVEESYLRLPSKVDAALNILKGTGITGLLKVDDDTRIENWDCIQLLKEQILPSQDYFGISYSEFPAGTHRLDYDHFKIHYMDLYWVLPKDTRFFIGSFYWLSPRAIQWVAERHLPFPLEDLSVAFQVEQMPGAKILALGDWYLKQWVTWDYEREL